MPTAVALAMQILPSAVTSLPMPPSLPEAPGALPLTTEADEQFLLRAFRSFSQAAGSLEQSYGLLQAEVARLHRELQESREGLSASLEENRRMREHLDRILEALPCGVLVVDRSGEFTRMNPEACRLLGVDASACAQNISIHGLPARLRDLMERAASGADDCEADLPGRPGPALWVEARHAALSGGPGSSSIFILRDITERKRLEQAQDKLRREQALAEMSAVLAHEIRNPLGSLELFAGLLAEAELNLECREWVEQVQAGLRTLGATVNNVLHFHRSPAPQRVPLDLGTLLDWARNFLAPLARQARVQMSVRNHLDGVWFPADRHRLEQVLLNLLLNAIRALPRGGSIELVGQCDGGGAASIQVSDTGPGIAPECLSEIFEPGFSTHSGSPGLGLAVCRRIVEQHGGSLQAGNRPGMGASFTVSFPLRAKANQEEGASVQ